MTNRIIDCKTFGKISLQFDHEFESLFPIIKRCLLLIDKGYERYSENQKMVFQTVNEITVFKKNELKKYQACAVHEGQTINFNPRAVIKNKTGGLIWVICHECYHLWDPKIKLQSKLHNEGNANLFANKIKIIIEKEPSIYKWG